MADFATLGIKITSSGAAKVNSDLKSIETQSVHTEKSVASLQKMISSLKALLAIGLGVQGINSLIQMADKMTALNAQVRLVTKSVEEYNSVNNQLFSIAQETRSSLEATTTLYTRSARALKDYGYSQQRILGFTETLNKAMVVGGVGAQEQASALFQLSQALGSGKLQGDEFRTIAEAAPIILDTVAEYMGKSRAEVKKLASDGKVTSQILFEAISGASQKISEKFKDMPLTFGQAVTQMQNSVLKWVSDLDTSTGIMGSLAQLVSLLSENFVALAKALAYATAAYIAFNAIAFASSFKAAAGGVGILAASFWGLTGAIRTATAALLANPLGLFVATVIGAAYVFDQFISDMKTGFGEFESTWGDVAVGVWEDFKEVVADVWRDVKNYVSTATSQISSSFGEAVSAMGDILSLLLVVVKELVNDLIRTFDFGYQSIILIWNNFPGAMEALAKGAANALVKAIEAAINFVLDKVKSLLELVNQALTAVGMDGFDLSSMEVKLPKFETSEAANDFKEQIGKVLDEVNAKDYLGDMWDGVSDYVVGAGVRGGIKRMLDETENKEADLSQSGAKTTNGSSSDKGKKKGGKKDRYLDMYNDYTSQIASLKADTESIAKFGGVSMYKEYDQLMEKLKTDRETFKNMTSEQISELKRLAAEVDNANMAKQVAQYAYDKSEELAQMQFEVALLRETQDEQDRLTYFRKIDQEVKQLSVGMSDEYTQKLLAEAEAMKKAYEEVKELEAQAKSDPIAGIRKGFDQFEEQSEDVMGNVSNITQNALNGMSNALTDLVTTGKADFRSLAQSIIKDIVQMTTRMMIFKAISSMAGGASGGGLADGSWVFYSGGGLVGFDTGGFTGHGGKYTPAGIVHKGEYVLTKEATSRLGVDYLDWLNYQDKSRPSSFSSGGGTGLPAGQRSYGNSQSVKVIINNNGEPVVADVRQEETSEGLQITVELLKKMDDIANKRYRKNRMDEQRAGGSYA